MVGPMQVNPKTFAALFAARATNPSASGQVAGKAQESPTPSDTFLGKLIQKFSFRPTPRVRQAQQSVSIQAAAWALGPTQALGLAQSVGMELFGPSQKAGEQFKARMADKVHQGSEQNSRMARVWSRIQSVAGGGIETPTLLDHGPSGPGRFVGNALFADAEAFAKLPEEVALFYTAHEVGHVENQDSARKQGMTLLKGLLAGTDQRQLVAARKQKDWEMEHRADARAAEICSQLKIDPVLILRDLMTEPSGDQHPPGMERARRVREVFASRGQAVSEQQWQTLTEETAPERERKQQAIDQDRALRAAFEELP